ncbi:uncharacterized protein LOC135140801 [Zophobas morio]|uniref:uncharacterized protein LOC135140801 n=1 Tax=Zophobas morio TaxID=2755281 RepID=UPI003082CEEC
MDTGIFEDQNCHSTKYLLQRGTDDITAKMTVSCRNALFASSRVSLRGPNNNTIGKILRWVVSEVMRRTICKRHVQLAHSGHINKFLEGSAPVRMKLKNVCLVLAVISLILLLGGIDCIANYHQAENLIGDEDRRAADGYNSDQSRAEANKRGLYETSGSHNGHQTYPSGYGEATFSNPGFAYGPSTVAQYYPVPGYPAGHGSYGLLGHTGQGGGYGYGHSAPAQGHGHGHGALALKGLLIPLAGIALLGAAAALSTNPVLLQLGVVNGRRRRRRAAESGPYINPR